MDASESVEPDISTTAFTPFGIESLKELMPMYRRDDPKA